MDFEDQVRVFQNKFGSDHHELKPLSYKLNDMKIIATNREPYITRVFYLCCWADGLRLYFNRIGHCPLFTYIFKLK